MAWDAEAARLRSAWPRDLPSDFDAVPSFRNYATDLAVEMLVRDRLAVESTVGLYLRGGAAASDWARFFVDDSVTRASRDGCRLRRVGRAYTFVHKSVPEFLTGCAMWSDVLAVVASGGRGFGGRSGGGGHHGSHATRKETAAPVAAKAACAGGPPPRTWPRAASSAVTTVGGTTV